MKIHFKYKEKYCLFLLSACLPFICFLRDEIKIYFYIHLPLKVIPNKMKIKFFISVSWRKVSHDLPLDVFIIHRAERRRQTSMFLRCILKVYDLKMIHVQNDGLFAIL